MQIENCIFTNPNILKNVLCAQLLFNIPCDKFVLQFNIPDNFMEQQTHEYNVGKRHLANMMGVDPETFTQSDIDVSLLFYLIYNITL